MAGLFGNTKSEPEKFDDAKGAIGKRSIQFDTYSGGLYAIAISNIGTMQIETDTQAHKQRRSLGWFLILAGIPLLFVVVGVVVIFIGIKMVRDKPTLHLAIGTCDGRTFWLGSKNKPFLMEMMRFIGRKIDDEQVNVTAQFDAKNAVFNISAPNGALAFGDKAQAVVNSVISSDRQPVGAM